MLQGHTFGVCLLAVVGGGTPQWQLVSGSVDHSVRLWDVDAGTPTAVLNGHTGSVRCLADLGGGRLLSGSWDGSLQVWNTATGACLAVVPNAHGQGSDGAFTAACALLGGAATGSYGGSVQLWKWDEGAKALTPGGAALQLDGGEVNSLAAVQGPDVAAQLLAGCRDGFLRVLDLTAGEALQQQAYELVGHLHSVYAVAVMMP